MTAMTMISMDDEREAYLALALTPGIGAARLRSLLSVCGTPLGALTAPFAFLCTVPGLSRAAATAVAAATPAIGRRALEDAHRLGGTLLLPGDDAYPSALTTIPDPPTALFALGRLELLPCPAVAVVGSRDHSPYGAEVARAVATLAAAAGIVVVSGMARGLDAVAHVGALDAGGGTIGVLGNGLGVVYPAANRRLYERAARDGMLLTEFPPGERPHAGSFPRRNRLISGLAAVTVIVEAAAGSGALITVDAALEQGREVLAVPGPIGVATSIGTNRLIRDGAGPYLEPDDLLRHYPRARSAAPPPAAVAPLPELPDDERALAALLAGGEQHVDQLADRAGRPVGAVLATLVSLEIAGVVAQMPGGRFRRI